MDPKAIVEDTVLLHENPHFKIIREDLRWPNDKTSEYHMLVSPRGFVMIIPLRNNESEIAIIRQYRATVRMTTIELPCGGLNSDELPETAALRELREEMGHEVFGVDPLPQLAVSVGTCRNTCYPFIARDPIEVRGPCEQDESEVNSGLRHEWISINEWRRMIRSGEVIDANSLAVWTVYWERRNQ